VRPEHSEIVTAAPNGHNSLPVKVSETAFEGNFVNVFLIDREGGTHMAQVPNDPAKPPPKPGSDALLAFAPEHAVLLVDAAASA
jgi:spermidine/putrescine transport system ATP-binding protein